MTKTLLGTPDPNEPNDPGADAITQYTTQSYARYATPGPKISATRPLPGRGLSMPGGGAPKPRPIKPVHSREGVGYRRSNGEYKNLWAADQPRQY